LGRLRRGSKEDQDLYDFICAREKDPVDKFTGTPGGLKKEHAPVPITLAMRFWLRLDNELAGATDESGCYHDPRAIDYMLREWGWEDDVDDFTDARFLMRCLGSGRAVALSEATRK
jgi:hypothetical protein